MNTKNTRHANGSRPGRQHLSVANVRTNHRPRRRDHSSIVPLMVSVAEMARIHKEA